MAKNILFEIDVNDRLPVTAFGPDGLALRPGDSCIIKMNGWLDFGRVVSALECECEESRAQGKKPSVVRRATFQDQSAAGENNIFSRTAQRKCQEIITALKLNLRLLKVRYSFDRSRLLVSCASEERVDLSGLVQELSKVISAKIEIRQLGVRDTAQVIGGMAVCGRELCCGQWLKNFKNVYIKMAKHQGLALSPSNINGMCGRLKCCLRFEDNCYVDMGRKMPAEGMLVETPQGTGRVVDRNVLRQKLKVCMDDKRMIEFEADQVNVIKPCRRENSSGSGWKSRQQGGKNEKTENTGDKRT